MLTFSKVRWKNLLGSGNAWTEIPLDAHPMTLIIGDNGSGKSTLLDALCFGLFNKPFRDISKDQLVNTLNHKDCMVEIEFTTNRSSYLVRRGHMPRLFEIEKNGIKLDQDANMRDQQTWFEKHVIKFNYKSFTQIVVLGASSFVPFMQLRPKVRRQVIEDLLDLQVFSEMNFILRSRMTSMRARIRELDTDLRVATTKSDGLRRVIDTIVGNRREQIVQLEKQMVDVKTKGIGKKDAIGELRVQMTQLQVEAEAFGDLSTEARDLTRTITREDHACKSLATHIKFFEENDTCPTCSQEMDESYRQPIIEKSNHDLIALQTTVADLTARAEEVDERVEAVADIERRISKITAGISGLLGEMRSSAAFIVKIIKEIAELSDFDDDSGSEQDELGKLLIETAKLDKAKEACQHQYGTYAIAADMLKDTGIKSVIINQYVPLINRLINKYLASMDFFVQFELDENFNETIRSRFRDDFSYESFSEGEKMRIDFALLLTWRSIAKLKNSIKTNLLVLDEIFDSSLDSQGMHDFLKLLQTLDSNIFLISHKSDVMVDNFTSTIRFEKSKNFSVIADETTT